MEGQFNKYKHSKVDSMDFDYDYSSLMHYGKRTFSKNGKPTVRAVNNPYMSLGRSVGFSDLDIKKMNALYDCKSKCWNFAIQQPTGLLKSGSIYTGCGFSLNQTNVVITICP